MLLPTLPVGVIEKPIPAIGPNDALIRTTAALICTSDTHTVAGAIGERSGTPHRIPSLDGLRAVSIGLVLLAHLAGTRSFPVTVESGHILALGELGVHVFFVISGFLITRLLLEELGSTGRISLSNFYFRRTMRIFPAYYCFLLVLAALSWGGIVQLASGDMAHALTYPRRTTMPPDRGGSDTRGRCRSKSSSICCGRRWS
jgi:hypothetical protein